MNRLGETICLAIVVFTSDNGGIIRATHQRPLRSWKGDLIRVPCIIECRE
jgi:arylsulfatase A-like enzyme